MEEFGSHWSDDMKLSNLTQPEKKFVLFRRVRKKIAKSDF